MTKKYSELTISDDFMFWAVLSNNLELCKELLELVLQVKIKKITPPEGQKTIEHKNGSRGIRLDVYVEDEANTVYDLEMQVVIKKDIPKRTRYYQGMIDLNLIKRGAVFKELKKSYIIFICTGDPFGRGLTVYTFENICIQDKSVKLGDEAVKVIVNPRSNRSGLSEDMNGFLDLLQGKPAIGGFAQRLSQAVEQAREHKKWEVEYMTMAMKLAEEREEGREEGRKEGREEGIMALIADNLEDGKTSDQIISRLIKRFNLTTEKAREYYTRYV